MKNGTINLLLSVIIPVYNGEKTINRAVESILNQPLSDKLEIIIVNDGSKDATKEIIDKIAENNDNVRVFHKENSGVSDTRNLAIEKSTGKYIAFLDADDWWEPNFFDADILEKLDADADLIQFSYRIVSTDKRYALEKPVPDDFKIADAEDKISYNWYHFCSVIYKKKLLIENKIEFFKTKFAEDASFAHLAFVSAKSYRSINKIIFNQYSNTNSVSHTMDKIMIFNESYKAFCFSKEWFEDRGEEYSLDYSMVMQFAGIWDDVCADFSYKKSVEFFKKDERFEVLNRSDDLPLTDYLKKKVYLWKNHPFRHWLYCKLVYKPERFLKNYLYSHSGIRRMFDNVFYIKKGYKRIDL